MHWPYLHHHQHHQQQFSGWWFQPLWNTVLVNGKDYPIYYGKWKMFETTINSSLPSSFIPCPSSLSSSSPIFADGITKHSSALQLSCARRPHRGSGTTAAASGIQLASWCHGDRRYMKISCTWEMWFIHVYLIISRVSRIFIHVYPIISRVSTCFNMFQLSDYGGAGSRNHPQIKCWWHVGEMRNF